MIPESNDFEIDFVVVYRELDPIWRFCNFNSATLFEELIRRRVEFRGLTEIRNRFISVILS